MQTWVSDGSSDGVSSFEEELDDPGSDEAASSGDADSLAGARCAVHRHILRLSDGSVVFFHPFWWRNLLVLGRKREEIETETGENMSDVNGKAMKMWREESFIYN